MTDQDTTPAGQSLGKDAASTGYNEVTLAGYNQHLPAYLDGTPDRVDGDLANWLRLTLTGMPIHARILELGSGTGRDANWIEQQGYTVFRTDASEAFLTHMRENGHEADRVDVLTDDLGFGWDLIFADAVLLHFTTADAQQVISKVFGALNPGGRFSFTLKTGIQTGWSTEKLQAPRYFENWTQTQAFTVLHEAGFTNMRNVSLDPRWLHLISDRD